MGKAAPPCKLQLLTSDSPQELVSFGSAFVGRDGIARRVVVDPGIEERDFVECRNLGPEGLAAGDLIVTSGQQSLVDNTPVDTAEN